MRIKLPNTVASFPRSKNGTALWYQLKQLSKINSRIIKKLNSRRKDRTHLP